VKGTVDTAGGHPRVSVVIPCFNAEAFIADTLDSVLASDPAPGGSLEVIVADDSSTDATLQVLAPYRDRVKVIENRANSGSPSRPRNQGIRESSGEFIAFCDHDDLWLADKLRKQLPLFHNERVGLVCTDALAFDERGVTLPSIGALRPLKRGWRHKDLLLENFIVSSTALVRRSALEQVGGFDESIFPGEDIDLWLRIATEWEIDRVPEVLVRYRSSRTQFSHNKALMHEARMRVVERHARARYPGREARRIIARNWKQIGSGLHWQRNDKEARAMFWRALRADPLDPACWLLLSSTLLPGKLTDSLVRARRRLRGSGRACDPPA